jgi:hypothetical protein
VLLEYKIFLLFGASQTKNQRRFHKLETMDYYSIVLSLVCFKLQKNTKKCPILPDFAHIDTRYLPYFPLRKEEGQAPGILIQPARKAPLQEPPVQMLIVPLRLVPLPEG